jgi:hypothetical protein
MLDGALWSLLEWLQRHSRLEPFSAECQSLLMLFTSAARMRFLLPSEEGTTFQDFV